MISPPFDRLPPEALRPFHRPPGAWLFRQGTPADAFVLVDAGAVELVRETPDGHRVVLGRAGAGETLGEASLFADAYHCDCLVRTEARGVMVRAAAVRTALSADLVFAAALLARLAGQLREARMQIEVMSIRSARDRVLAALHAFGQRGTVTGFAAGLGLTQEACSRALAALVAEGRVRRVARGRYAVVE